MRWLLTTGADSDLDDLAARLAPLGVSLDDEPPVPLDGGEQVVFANGPRDLPQRLAQADLGVRANRNSDVELY